MRMDDQRESDNLEDRRGSGMGGGGGLRLGGGRMGLGTIAIALVASYFLGVNPLTVLNMLSGGGMPAIEQSAPAAHRPPADDQMAKFVSKVLASTEDTWNEVFRANGRQYQEPKLVLFTGATPTACGTGQSAMGPFYCPGDQKVYIDLAFYRDLKDRFKAPGEFAQAYVIAHEVGHHVQNLLGIAEKVHTTQQRVGKAEANALSVRMELQADCLAGVWGKRTDTMKNVLEPGDLEAALTAASAIGDDRLQQQAQGRIVPESFTHGSSDQRVRWFRKGFETGDMNQCNTFKTDRL
ncbi:KPN_02809 family neutral zinc metallopeptidase [Ferribacterium limneticum]|uniref:KPN_02809 family neutral zinc metallopeptidase n=1 Tax=Ferribacterium limneticum TaxID=76259 RepID=UPI001CF9623E|nr:neutral zinc metallopeptidase [Ferribacterium limneticum]UCV29205.1 zinc metallopeptidase [Ferribacterium limneticum]UCV33124.1 zinc metallopeptidase [Ferribacterium limneticum]